MYENKMQQRSITDRDADRLEDILSKLACEEPYLYPI